MLSAIAGDQRHRFKEHQERKCDVSPLGAAIPALRAHPRGSFPKRQKRLEWWMPRLKFPKWRGKHVLASAAPYAYTPSALTALVVVADTKSITMGYGLCSALYAEHALRAAGLLHESREHGRAFED